MGDEFTSVQWDKDDLDPHMISGSLEPVEEEVTASPTHSISESITKSLDKSKPLNSPAYYIHSTVSDPLKESDGSNNYISYLIKTTTNNPVFQSTTFQIRRRFSDFNFLYQCLLNDFPTAIVPPLPNKLRLEYIKGDRFSEGFTTKRAISLNIFLQRVSKYESLSSSKIYQVFLENSDYWNTYKQSLKLSTTQPSSASDTNDKISDYIMNAFKKPNTNTPNTQEFQDITARANKLQENLIKIDKVYSKVLKKQNELSTNFMKFGDEFVKLNRLINDSTEENTIDIDQALVKNFKSLSHDLHKISSASDDLTIHIDHEFLIPLKDLEHYIVLFKNSVKLKDSKLIDHEALLNYLSKAKSDKQAILHNGSVSTADAAIKFFSKKLESITGTDTGYGSANSANSRILKLNSKIAKLEQEAQTALEVYQNFEKDLLKEYYTKFEPIKTEEVSLALNKLAEFNLKFFNTLLEDWQSLDENLVKNEGNHDDDSIAKPKLTEDSKFLQRNDISENQDLLKSQYDEIVKIHEERSKLEGQDQTHLLLVPNEEFDNHSNSLIDDDDQDMPTFANESEDDEEDDLLTASMLAQG